MTIKDSDTTIVSINQGKMVILILMYYHSNTTIVSINPGARDNNTITFTIQIQLLFLLIPIFISISFFIIAFKILLLKDIKNSL